LNVLQLVCLALFHKVLSRLGVLVLVVVLIWLLLYLFGVWILWAVLLRAIVFFKNIWICIATNRGRFLITYIH
jgi:hypothetical protein